MNISVMYHLDDDAWWAESPDIPGWTIAGATFAEIRALAEDGARFALERDDVDVRHLVPQAVLPWLQRTVGAVARVEYRTLQAGHVRVGEKNAGGAPAEDFAAIP